MPNLMGLFTADRLEAAAATYGLVRMIGGDLLRLLHPGTGKHRQRRRGPGRQDGGDA
jgi:hypothetical protein